MTASADDFDPPTVAQVLSPRARTTMGRDGGAPTGGPEVVALQHHTPSPFDDDADEPTVALAPRSQSLPEPPDTSSASVQNTSQVLQQLETSPERTLARAAAPILLIIAQLRNSIERADVSALRRQIEEELDRFQQRAQRAGVEEGDILVARYVLCATMDETVLMTPWGSRSEWSANSLVNKYHNETWGGEKVFEILDRIRGNAENKLQLLILIHACLMLGFEGRYRILERGRDQLDDLRIDLSRTIRRYSKVKADGPLSKDVKGLREGRRLQSYMQLWMVGLGMISLLIVLYLYIDFTLTGALAPVISKLQALTGG